MSAKHSPEPWAIHPARTLLHIRGNDGRWIVAVSVSPPRLPERDLREASVERATANAARAVACVNACAGIDDPETTVPELVKYASAPGGYLVFDPDDEGALCLIATDPDDAWRQAAPMLGYDAGESLDSTDYVCKRLSSKDAATHWQEAADLREAVYGILRCLRPSPRITSEKPAIVGFEEALDEAAKLVDWDHDSTHNIEAVPELVAACDALLADALTADEARLLMVRANGSAMANPASDLGRSCHARCDRIAAAGDALRSALSRVAR